MVKIITFISAGVLLAAMPFSPFRNHSADQYASGYTAGYTRAATDIKIFAAGTGQLPNGEWAKRAAAYRLNKIENQSDGVALGLLPDPKTTLQPLPQ